MILLSIKNILANDVAYAAAIGTDQLGTSKRIFAGIIPQNEPRPAALLNEVTGVEEGRSKGRNGELYAVTVQLDHFGDDYATVYNLSQLAIAALEGYEGIVLGEDIDHIKVLERGIDLHDDESLEFHRSQDFLVYIKT